MTPFEEQLKQALARQSPAADFSARLEAAVEDQKMRRESAGFWRWFGASRALRLASVLAALLIISGGAMYQEHRRVIRGEAAKQQLLTALRIAGSKLNDTRHRVLDMQAPEVQQ